MDNVVRCRPPNNYLEGAPWEIDATNCCSIFTQEEIERYKPKVIVPLGNVPTNFLLGKKGIEDLRGYVYNCTIYGHSCYVIPTYHPSFIMRGAHNLTEVQAIDIRRALKVARSGFEEPPCTYVENPTLYDIENFIEGSTPFLGNFLAADIETPRSGGTKEDEYGEILDTDILRISFSYRPGYAITIPFNDYYFDSIQRILALPFAFTVFWNQEFDVPRLLSKGLVLGRTLDAMYMWHFLQSDLPKGLGYVATFYTDMREWKSLSEDAPLFYSCRDADATIQCANKIRDLLVAQKRYDSFLSHYVDLKPHINTMARSGVLIDKEQQAKFRGEVDKELGRIDDEIQSVVPIGVRSVKQRKSVPADAEIGGTVRSSDPSWYWDYDRETGEWLERQRFLYGSPQQVLRYMRDRGHPVPQNHKTGKDTTAAAEIEKLADKYPDDELYPRILNAREFRKIIGQYIDGYAPDPDGRVRTHFERKPSTWRFDSYAPNVQNVLKRSELAGEYRKQFVAAPGHYLVELDYKAIEAVLTGFYAEDPAFMRAAGLGVHAILMSHVSKRPISLTLKDSDILELAKALKRTDEKLYDACKRVVHMSNYGGSPRRMRIEYPELFKNTAAAKEIQDIYFATIAKKVRRWQQLVLARANGPLAHLENVFGYRHYFYDVLHYVGQQLEWGTDAKRALAFLPQSTAAGILSEALLKLADTEVFCFLRWIIHDSIVAEIPDDDRFLERVGVIKTVMEAPLPKLGGLSVKVEVSYGRNWGEMKDLKV